MRININNKLIIIKFLHKINTNNRNKILFQAKYLQFIKKKKAMKNKHIKKKKTIMSQFSKKKVMIIQFKKKY